MKNNEKNDDNITPNEISRKTEMKDYTKNEIEIFNPNTENNYKSYINLNNNADKYLDYNNYELNSLSYLDALRLDNRTFFQFYYSLLKYNNLFLFTFFPNDDYNSRIIKILLYLFLFSLNLTINSLFFTEETLHKIYEDKGSFNLIYKIPQILYSTII